MALKFFFYHFGFLLTCTHCTYFISKPKYSRINTRFLVVPALFLNWFYYFKLDFRIFFIFLTSMTWCLRLDYSGFLFWNLFWEYFYVNNTPIGGLCSICLLGSGGLRIFCLPLRNKNKRTNTAGFLSETCYKRVRFSTLNLERLFVSYF